MAPAIDLDTPLRLHPLTSLPDGDWVTVGRPDTDVFVALPVDGAKLLEELQGGRSPSEAARWYATTYGSDVDIQAFVGSLTSLGFVADEAVPAGTLGPLRFRRLARALFSPLAFLAYLAVCVAGVVVLATTPAVRPGPQVLQFGGSITWTYLLLTFGSLPFLFLHEFFHVLAGRRLGLDSSTRISHRFFFLVLETQLKGLVAKPRRQRFLPILAGILIDVVVFFALTLLAAWLYDRQVEPWLHICLALSYAMLLRVAWQFYFCMRTDIYHLVEVMLGTSDLHNASRWLIGTWVAALLRRDAPRRFARADWSEHDLRHARWYAPVILLGYSFLAVTAVLAVGPTTHYFWSTSADNLVGPGRTPTSLVDAVAFLALNLTQLALAGWLFLSARAARTLSPAPHSDASKDPS